MHVKPVGRKHVRPSIPHPDDIPVYRASEVARIVRVSPTTFYRWLEEGKFPDGVRIIDLKPARWSLNTIRAAMGLPAFELDRGEARSCDPLNRRSGS